jgi:hypothetical protein
MSMRTLHLDREYEKTLSDSARLLDNERDRMRRVELMFLRFDNEALQSELEEVNGHLAGLTSTDSEACFQLKDACQEIDRLERQGQAYSAEIDRLKVSSIYTCPKLQCMNRHADSNRKNSQPGGIIQPATILFLQRKSTSPKISRLYRQSSSGSEHKIHYTKASLPRNMRWSDK